MPRQDEDTREAEEHVIAVLPSLSASNATSTAV